MTEHTIRKADARHVSRVLAMAGLTRSSAYTTWGYETPGFIVRKSTIDDNVNVLWSLKGEALFDASTVAERALTDAGFEFHRAGRWDHPTHPSRTFTVTGRPE